MTSMNDEFQQAFPEPHMPEDPILDPRDPLILDSVASLVSMTGVNTETFEGRQVTDLVETALKLIPDGRDSGELRLLCAAFKELRYAFNVFAQYENTPKLSIFGSARTPEDHPDYLSAVEFARLMAKTHQWMVITGAGDGIMKAGHEGPGRDASFGVSIRLPFETTANSVILGDEKLINFRYFFTRKLIFVSQSNAVALYPGGFGTQDENFEALTLIQTGKSHLVPVVMLEGGEDGAQAERGYWKEWDRYVRTKLLGSGWISESDLNLYYLASSPEDAANHIRQFYRNYHSNRYVRDQLVIRLNGTLAPEQLDRLNTDYASLVQTGRMTQRGPFDVERDYRDMNRLCFQHTKRDWGMVRCMIDRINSLDLN